MPPGRIFVLAVRGINGPGTGRLHHARLVYSLFAPFERSVQDTQFVDRIAGAMPPVIQARVQAKLVKSEGQFDKTDLGQGTILPTVSFSVSASSSPKNSS